MGHDTLWHRGALAARRRAQQEPAQSVQFVWQRYGTQRHRARRQRTVAQHATGKHNAI